MLVYFGSILRRGINRTRGLNRIKAVRLDAWLSSTSSSWISSWESEAFGMTTRGESSESKLCDGARVEALSGSISEKAELEQPKRDDGSGELEVSAI